jgi:hypothetical protein
VSVEYEIFTKSLKSHARDIDVLFVSDLRLKTQN